MNKNNYQQETDQITKITRIGMYANIGLAGVKLVTGLMIGSLALIADGLHSLSDLVTDLAVLIGTYIGSRPPDDNHPFGHGKFETMFTMIIAIVLIMSGGLIGWEAIKSIKHSDIVPNGWGIITIAVISILVKEILYRATKRIADRTYSQALEANAWHHRTDAFSSVIVLFGGGAALLGWNSGDSAAGLFVGIIVIVVGVKIGYRSLWELSESSAGADIEAQITDVLDEFKEIHNWHRLRTRRIGREIEMDVHVVLDRYMPLIDVHRVVHNIELAIESKLKLPITITIHTDPDTVTD